MADTQQFDIIVIGGGSGLTAAYHALQDDRSVALVDERPDALGGTCVNFGCIPTKQLIQSAEVMDTIRNAESFGIYLDQAGVQADFGKIMHDMRATRAENTASVSQWVEQSMRPFYSRARFVGDKLLETEDGQCLTADKIFLATGARPAIPGVEGLEETGYLTSTDVLELEKQPQSLLIVGGGYVGAEFGHFFASMGTRVTVIDGSSRLLDEDDEIREVFTREFGRSVDLVTGRAVSAHRDGGTKSVTVVNSDKEHRTLNADEILIAAGRQPNSESLDLPMTGVEVDDKGAVLVDDYLCTRHADIYAYGDIIGRGMFKHTSSYEGGLAYRNSRGANEKVSYRANPHAVFSNPQVGAVGLTERQCRDRGLDYKVARSNYTDTAKGKIIGAQAGFAKLIVDAQSDRILGFHMLGPRAADLVHEVVVAMTAGDGKAEAVRRSIHIHPSLPEVIQEVFSAV